MFKLNIPTAAIICTCAIFVGVFAVGRTDNAWAQTAACAWKHADGSRCDESIERCAEGCPLITHDGQNGGIDDNQNVVTDDVDVGGDQPVEPPPVDVDQKTYWMILTEDHGTNNAVPDAADETPADSADQVPVDPADVRLLFKKVTEIPTDATEIPTRVVKFEDLKPGEIVTAGEFEYVKIVFKNSSEQVLQQPNTSFQVESPGVMNLIRGAIRYFKERWDTRTLKEIRTTHGRAAPRNTDFLLSVNDDSTMLQVLDGSVEMSDVEGKTSVLVQAGYLLTATEAGLGQPEPIEPNSIEPWFLDATSQTQVDAATSTIPGISDTRLALLAGIAGMLILVWFVRPPKRK